jgi:AcrR family transcriptional regulator
MAGQLRRERLRRRTTDEIIGTARLLLEKDGPSAISVRAIARQVGVTGPAIYRYYPSLDALMSALSESVISELCAVVESARDQAGGMALQFHGRALDQAD